MSGEGAWDANAGEGVASAGAIGLGADGYGLGAVSGVYSSTDGWDGRGVAHSALQVSAAVAGNIANFSGGATAGGGAIAGVAIGMLGNALQGGLDAYDAQSTIAKLKEVLKKAYRYKKYDLAEVIEGCVGKAQNKRSYGIAKASIIGQIPLTGYRAGRGIAKAITGQKGAGRRRRAEKLLQWAESGDMRERELAKEAICAICGADFKKHIQTSLENAMKS